MDATNAFFPMDFGAMPMQTDGANGLAESTPVTTQSNNANAFAGSDGVFMGVGGPEPKPASGPGYAMGFMLPKTN